MADTVTIPKKEYEQMKAEIETLRNTDLYKKILDSKKRLQKKIYTREDLGF